MKRLAIVILAVGLLGAGTAATLWANAAQDTGVSGAGEGVFPAGAELSGVKLSGSTFGTGAFISPDGSAEGHFQMTLLGTNAAGLAQNIEVAGEVQTGSSQAEGTVTFGGAADVDMGDGIALPSVPFTVTVSAQGLQLVLGETTLPTQTIGAGAVDID
jgi:hypothetical protein